jgi:hypothetical protein
VGGQSSGCVGGGDDINLERTDFGRESREPVQVPFGRPGLDDQILVLDIAEFVKSLPEHVEQRGKPRVARRKHAYAEDLAGCASPTSGVAGRPPARVLRKARRSNITLGAGTT